MAVDCVPSQRQNRYGVAGIAMPAQSARRRG